MVIEKLSPTVASAGITLICLAAVPGLMAKEGWDDHNRAGRYTSRDFAYNYLNSCAPNAIIFTNGDNDTFPLWYIPGSGRRTYRCTCYQFESPQYRLVH
ncbi:MAG: hypothetical protein IPN13_14615 [Bacteroidetes bacterium]|nr:hypothetical protein [Bacteroidota bacterium]